MVPEPDTPPLETDGLKRKVTLIEDRQPDTDLEPTAKKQRTEGEANDELSATDEHEVIDKEETEKPETNNEDSEMEQVEHVPQLEEKPQDEPIESTQIQNSETAGAVDKVTLIKAALSKTGDEVIKTFTHCELKKDNKKKIHAGIQQLHEKIHETLKPKKKD